MKQKNYLTLDDEFIQFCKLNNIDNIEKLAKETFNKGFTILKYGDRPDIKIQETKPPKIEEEPKPTIPPININVPIVNKVKKDLYDE